MTRHLLAAMVCIALAGGVSFAAEESGGATKKKSSSAATQPATPVNKICPVDRNNPVDPNVTTIVYKGKVIGFCCEDCMAKFLNRAEYYIKDME